MSTPNSANALARNISYLATSEVSIRITRLATAMILARNLSAHEFGIIAIAMTVQEIVQTLTRNGIGAKIVQTDSTHLTAVCNTVYRLNWLICLTLFALQCLLAQPIADFYQEPALVLLIVVLAVPYLIYPWSMVQVYLVQRENRLKLTALASGGQVSLDNLCSAALALTGFGIWAVITPKLVVAPLWVLYYRSVQKWRPNQTKYPKVQRDILTFSAHVFGAEICSTARRHVDRLLIGYFLGLDLLGIYYFAVNSGLGLTLSLSSAFNTAFYPHLCAQKANPSALAHEFKRGLFLVSTLSLMLFGSQALLAPWYVPMIFGTQWTHAIPLLVILTLSGITRPAAETCAQMLRAINQPRIDFRWNVFFTLCLSGSLYMAVQKDLATVAMVILMMHLLLIPVYVFGCWHLTCLGKSKTTQKKSKQNNAMIITQELSMKTQTSHKKPLISVIIPCYNSADTLAVTVKSVQQQSYRPLEVIIINDGSTDSSSTLADHLAASASNIKVLHIPNGGVSAARNLGAEVAQGEYLAFLDADDVWYPEKLTKQLAFFKQRKNLGVCYAKVRFTSQAGESLQQYSSVAKKCLTAKDLLIENQLCTSSNIMCRKAVFQQIGGFDTRMNYAEDQEWLIRVALSQHWQISGVNEVLLDYRTQSNSLSSSLRKMELGWQMLVTKIQSYAPEFIDSSYAYAQAVYLRYLARRSLRQGEPASTGLRYIIRALQSDWHILIKSPWRSGATLLGLLCWYVLPNRFSKQLLHIDTQLGVRP